MKRITVGPDADVSWEDAINGRADLSSGEVVVVGAGAASRMEELHASGVSMERLSWLDGDRVRDYHWRGYFWGDDPPPRLDEKFRACGVDGVGDRVRWRSHELGLIAGPAGCGKSLFAQILAQDFVATHDAPVSLTCWEDDHDEILYGLSRYRDNVLAESKRSSFLSKFRFTKVDDDSEREVSKHLARIEYEANRFGIKFFVLDPWNEFDHLKHSKQTEADYVINVLTKCASLCRKLNVIIMVTTHVSSEYISIDRRDFKPFKINNAFGTSQYGNKVHRGFCIARTEKWSERTHMVVRQDKVKLEDKMIKRDGRLKVFRELMGYRDTMVLEYQPETNSLAYCNVKSHEAKEKW